MRFAASSSQPGAGTGPRTRGTRLLSRAVLGALCLIQVGVTAGASFLMHRTWQLRVEQAHSDVRRAALTAEGSINRILLQADSALASVPSLLADLPAGPEGLTSAAASRKLRILGFQLSALRDVMLIQPDGTVFATARQGMRRGLAPLYIEEAFRGAPVGSAVIVGPLRAAAGAEWRVYVIRSVEIARLGRTFVAAEVPATALTAGLEAVATDGLSFRIYRRDDVLIARHPHDEAEIGKAARISLPASAEPRPIMLRDPEGESQTGLVAMARPTLYSDVRIAVTLDLDHAHAEWLVQRGRLLFVYGCVTLVILCFAVLFVMGFRRSDRLEVERAETQRQMELAIEAMSDGFVMWDRDDRFVTCNTKYLQLYRESAAFIRPGATFSEIMRQGALAGQYPQMNGDVDGFVQRMTEWHRSGAGAFERLLPDGTWLLVTERRTANGDIVGIRTDITEMKRAQEELLSARLDAQQALDRLSQQHMLFDAALQNMSQGLLMVDAGNRVIVANARLSELFGMPATGAEGLDVRGFFSRVPDPTPESMRQLAQMVMRQEELASDKVSGAFVAIAADGRAVAVAQRPLPDGGFVATYEDVTERQESERRIRHLALHDPLTDLPNRAYLKMALDAAISRRNGPLDELALVYFDLDRFKDVNDTLGHPVGDNLLVGVAARVNGVVQPGDVVARLGGDEFAILVTGLGAWDRARALGEALVERLHADFRVGHHKVSIGVSVGVALADDGAIGTDELFKRADVALYAAKGAGRGQARVFSPEMSEPIETRMRLETALREAIVEGQLELAYQPIFHARTRKLVSFEALMRWNHPEMGWVSPGQFIPVAEETGLIEEMGAWCLDQACREAAQMPPDISIAVNLSPVQLKTGRLEEIVRAALERSGLAAGRLELEVTETALLSCDEPTLSQLRRLQAIGVRVNLDDFGVGFSSLNYLRRFPFDKIKIDQVFVREAVDRDDCRAIIRAIVQLADSLGIRTTAEGVETQDQLDLMQELGAAEAQGYFLGRPEPILKAMLRLAEAEETASVGDRPKRRRSGGG